MSRPAARVMLGLTGLACATLLVACAGPRQQYEKALWAQTGRARVVWQFGTALDLRATYLSPAFRETLLAEQRRLLGPVDDPTASTRSAQDGEAYHEIVMSAASSLVDDRVEIGVDRGWKIRLVDEAGADQPLVSVYRLDRDTALDRSLYAHDTVWSELWVARFARVTERPARLVLHLGSGYGHTEIAFEGVQLH